MKTWVTLGLIILSFTTGFSQKDKDAKIILDKATALFTEDKGVEVSFNTSSYQQGALKGQTEGKLYLKKESFVIQTTEMQTWYDGKTQWSLIFDMEEVNVSNPTEEELQEINPYRLLNLYRKGYSYQLGEKIADRQEVVLKAQDKNKEFQTITVWVNTKLYEPSSFEVVLRDGTVNKVGIKQIKKNLILKDGFFKFNESQYPDAEIIDLR